MREIDRSKEANESEARSGESREPSSPRQGLMGGHEGGDTGKGGDDDLSDAAFSAELREHGNEHLTKEASEGQAPGTISEFAEAPDAGREKVQVAETKREQTEESSDKQSGLDAGASPETGRVAHDGGDDR